MKGPLLFGIYLTNAISPVYMVCLSYSASNYAGELLFRSLLLLDVVAEPDRLSLLARSHKEGNRQFARPHLLCCWQHDRISNVR
jgi:hypothetical protein